MPIWDERKTVGDSYTHRRDHALGEEVARDKRVHVEPDEFLPSGLTSPSPVRLNRNSWSFGVSGRGARAQDFRQLGCRIYADRCLPDRCRGSRSRQAVSLELSNTYVECRGRETDKTDTHYLTNSV